MHKDNILTAKVNFIISVCFIGSSALLGIVTMLEAAKNPNPLAEVFYKTIIMEDVAY